MREESSLKLGLWFATALSLIISACSSSSGPARTVSYFQAHPKEREALYQRCVDDPGALGKTAECVNAEQAQALEGLGSFRHLAPMHFPPVPGPAVKKGASSPNTKSGPSP